MSQIASSPTVNPALLGRVWPARWATAPDALGQIGTGGSVFLFRRSLSMETIPATFVVHISADQRYRLFVNGRSVCFGPARGDLLHWRYETVDLAPYLTPGENILAARVHFFTGENTPVAQITSGFPGLLVQGDTDAEAVVNTPNDWRVMRDAAYSFTQEPANALWSYCVVGPSEIFDAAKYPDGWLHSGFNDSAWHPAVTLKGATAFGTLNAETHWWLVPRPIPLMEETPTAFGSVRRAEGIASPASLNESEVIPANTKVSLLVDHGVETCVFPSLTVSGGAGATVTLSYAEALQEYGSRPNEHAKGNRNDIEGKILRGYADTWLLAGGEATTTLDTLWWRTFRYAELTIQTADEPLTIHSVSATYTGYPWVRQASFDAPEMPDLSAIREVGWRTLRLCTHETFMDCPYYEQLQYAGDTRIQCLASLYETGDARLFRNALQQFEDSRASFGLTMSRYPSRIPQVIPPFSLWWICMAHDYWRHVPDGAPFVHSLLPGVRSVLEWFTALLRADGLLGPVPHWNFVDWCIGWKDGDPPGAVEGGSSILTLQFALALQAAQELFASAGDHATARQYEALAKQTVEAIRRECYSAADHRVADTPDKRSFSQHGGFFAVLAGLAESATERQAILQRVQNDDSMTQATFYCRFYLHRALVAAGQADDYLSTLPPWRDMLALGLTTWAEKPEPTRSDCHAWSASPNYELLATVLGVAPGEPGWETTTVTPALGTLTHCSGVVPIPGGGEVAVSYRREGTSTLHMDITLPESGPGSRGTIVWNGVSRELVAGRQALTLSIPA